MTAPIDRANPLAIGTKVKPWGHISAVAILKGERYYFFIEKGVAMIPGVDVERHARLQSIE